MSANPGASWENAAAEYLKRQGAVILARNYRRGPGEVDLIAKMDGFVAFIEVKQRFSLSHGTPGEAVNRLKQTRICGAALYFLKEHKLLDERIRFDVIEIDPDGLRHIKSAFSYVQSR
jgi:putative endonuclease